MLEFFENGKIIQAHDADFTNRLRLDSLFTYLQDTAAAHADKLDLGYTSLIKHNFAWVLSWTKVEIASLPGFGEEIRIKTWPKLKYKLYSLRDFLVYNHKEEIIIKATSAWLPINLTSKRIIDTSSLPAPINYQEKVSAMDGLPEKISEMKEKEFLYTRQMRYTDIDLNQHVNNIKYIEMISDCFTKEKHEKFMIKSIRVNFVSESRYDDSIEVYRSANERDNSYLIEGSNKSSSKTIFQAEVQLSEKV